MANGPRMTPSMTGVLTGPLRHREALRAFASLAIVASVGLSPAWAQTGPTHTPENREAFARARQLADEKRFDESIPIARDLVARDPDMADYGLFLARCLGWAERHSESADAYLALATRHPGDMPAFGREWAQQLVWAERHEEAVALYDQLLAREPDDLELREARARAIAWSGDARGAVDAYRDLIAEAPANGEYRHGYAQNLTWTGRESTALQFLRRVPADLRTPEETALLESLASRARAPWARAMFATSSDSDDLDITTWELEGGMGVVPRLWIGASYRRDELEAPDRAIDVSRVGGIVRFREGPFTAAMHLRLGDAEQIDVTPLTGRVGLAWRLGDLFTVALDGERTDYESIRAMEREVIGQFATASLHVHPRGRVDGRAALGVGVVDGPGEVVANDRVSGAVEIGYLALPSPRLRVAASAYAFSFSELTADGYWNPDDYRIFGVGADFNPRVDVLRSELVLAGFVGVQNENPGGDATSTGSLTVRVIVRPGGAFRLEYRFDTSDSGLDSDRGFARTRHEVSVTGSF